MLKYTLPALAAAALVGAAFWFSAPRPAETVTSTTALGLSEIRDVQATPEDREGYFEWTVGSEDAPVTIIEYGSFTCPHCATFHLDVLPRLKAEFVETGKARFVYREVYFDKYGLWAGIMARCGGEERYPGMVDLIYERQATWARGSDSEVFENLSRLARLAGIGDDQIAECARDEANALMLVSVYQENAERDGITSTPSFMINGTRYGNMSLQAFRDLIAEKAGN